MSRLAALLTRWACAALSLAAFTLGAVGCHDSPSGPGGAARPFIIPSLEPVPFEAIGSGKVAFERIGNDSAGECCGGTVYVIDAVARTTTHILDSTSFAGPAMSPGGQAIAYDAFTDNTTGFDVYVRGIDGAQPRRISEFSSQEGPPSWTPNGSAIVLTGSSDNLLWNV